MLNTTFKKFIADLTSLQEFHMELSTNCTLEKNVTINKSTQSSETIKPYLKLVFGIFDFIANEA